MGADEIEDSIKGAQLPRLTDPDEGGDGNSFTQDDGLASRGALRDRAHTSRSMRTGLRFTGLADLAVPSAEAPKLRLTVGRVIPGTRYRIVKWLGEGGMGV